MAEANRDFLKRLRGETHAAHMAVEETVDIKARLASPGSYRTLLERFYGLHAALEKSLALSPLKNEPDVGLPERSKLDWLRKDLKALGYCEEQIAALPTPALVSLQTKEDALGCLYVLEGASLGGQIIARLLHEKNIDQHSGGRHFYGYGDDVGRMWRGFGDFVCTHVPTKDQQDRMIEAANQTFDTFRKWIK